MFPTSEEIIDQFQNSEFLATRPKHLSPAILKFCDSLEADAPVTVDVHPSPKAALMHCFSNVAEAVTEGHGETQTGWLIWEFPGVYLTAERHAVLKTPDGYVDLTPQPDGHRRVLFTEAMDDGVSEDASIQDRIGDVTTAITAVRKELIDKLPKMKRAGRLDLGNLEVEVLPTLSIVETGELLVA